MLLGRSLALELFYIPLAGFRIFCFFDIVIQFLDRLFGNLFPLLYRMVSLNWSMATSTTWNLRIFSWLRNFHWLGIFWNLLWLRNFQIRLGNGNIATWIMALRWWRIWNSVGWVGLEWLFLTHVIRLTFLITGDQIIVDVLFRLFHLLGNERYTKWMCMLLEPRITLREARDSFNKTGFGNVRLNSSEGKIIWEHFNNYKSPIKNDYIMIYTSREHQKLWWDRLI